MLCWSVEATAYPAGCLNGKDVSEEPDQFSPGFAANLRFPHFPHFPHFSRFRKQQANQESRKIPLYLVLDTTPEMTIRKRETFGPYLMVLPYQEPREVIDYVNSHDRPLALYPSTNKKKLANLYINRIMSGGVTVNDALPHVAQHDIPFGGVGQSGLGHYHGYEGFISCSKLRPVFYQARFLTLKFLAPPYGKLATRAFDFLARLKD